MAICEYLRLCTIHLTYIKFVLTQAIFRNDDDDDDDNTNNSINFFIICVLAQEI
jgi:hypothetical protein